MQEESQPKGVGPVTALGAITPLDARRRQTGDDRQCARQVDDRARSLLALGLLALGFGRIEPR